MVTDVVCVEIPGNRDDVLRILKRTGISGVPVLKEGELVGIITRKDLLRKAEETQLGLLMTPDPVVIRPDAPISEAAQLLVRHNIRRLPVIEDGEPLHPQPEADGFCQGNSFLQLASGIGLAVQDHRHSPLTQDIMSQPGQEAAVHSSRIRDKKTPPLSNPAFQIH